MRRYWEHLCRLCGTVGLQAQACPINVQNMARLLIRLFLLRCLVKRKSPVLSALVNAPLELLVESKSFQFE